ncbi:MAG TPA: hypothetical protein VNK81_08120 [Thermodesulfobacteriota bacterium]|jgi:hypothetical protein|nr:hypothetical protein [Thermodesulfobacteriota bacterium]
MPELIGRVVTFDLRCGELKIKDKLGNEFEFKVPTIELIGIEEGDEVMLEFLEAKVKSVTKIESFRNQLFINR